MNKLAVFLAKGDKTWHDIPKAEQANFLNSLRTPKDTIDRGWLQYKCQMYFVSHLKVLLLNIAAACVFPFVMLGLLMKRKPSMRKINAIGDFKNMEEVLPLDITDTYDIDNNVWGESGSLKFSDLSFCLKLVRKFPLSPLFVSKCVMKIAKYSRFISAYNPDAIIVRNEYSYTSSVLTAYCRQHNVKHIDVMHGEKLYHIRDSFFEYDECYVWSEHYVKLLTDMRACENQFRVAIPPSIKFDNNLYKNERYFSDYKYYLAEFNGKEIKSIVESMKFAKRAGKTVKYRPHPRYSNIELLKRYVSEDEIEWPTQVPILSSISNTRNAVGSYSTVLLQAYYNGINVVCDDLTYHHVYRQLKEYNWILSNAQTVKLSELQ